MTFKVPTKRARSKKKEHASMLNPGNYPLEAFDGSCILKKGQRILIIAYLAAFPFPPAQAETKVSASTFVFKT
ncbi:hypothetical protein ACHAW5_000660 [Stephanodiscus triporus]|uniref:Uncharacterized protein n=1 Tax=Stephanodiscus triporus TaxID=2934178 RepID=A0ABD3PGD5_9STRA